VTKAEAHLEVYRRFEGSLREYPLRFWPIWTTGLRTALKQRKALALLYAPALIATVIFSFIVYLALMAQQAIQQQNPFGNDPNADLSEVMVKQAALQMVQPGLKMLEVVRQIVGFNQLMGLFSFLAVVWFGSGLFCDDRKAGAHQLYFARPITRLDYFSGKFLIAAFFSLLAMLVPVLVICIVASVTSEDWVFVKEQWDVFPRAIAFSCLWTVVIVSLVLLCSSVAPRRVFAMIGAVGFLMIGESFAAVLGQVVNPRFFALGLMNSLHAVCLDLFNQPAEHSQAAAGDAWLAIGVFVALALGVIALRLKRLEVVA